MKSALERLRELRASRVVGHEGVEPAITLIDDIPLTAQENTQEAVAADAPEPTVTLVPYQRLYVDYDMPDKRDFTPTELRQARKRLRPWGDAQHYTLVEDQEGSHVSGVLPPELRHEGWIFPTGGS